MKTRSLFLILATAAAFLRAPVLAREVTVTTVEDGVAGSLRWVIEHVGAGDTITFTQGLDGDTILLTSGELLINKSLTIQGPGANRLAISGNATSRIFHIKDLAADATVNISGLLITNGRAVGAGIDGLGGGILFEGSGTLNLDRCELAGNLAVNGGGSYIRGSGTNSAFLNLTDCSIVENRADTGCGAVIGGCTVKMLNCTISENRSDVQHGSGGGIFAATASLDLENCTVARNKLVTSGGVTTYGGGIELNSSEFKLRNTVIAGNEADVGPDIHNGSTSSLGHNLIGVGPVTGLVASDQVGTAAQRLDPKLGDLQKNGGPTRTHALLSGSPALDAGDDADLPEFDQRGEGYRRKSGANVDIGAFEFQFPNTAPNANCQDVMVSANSNCEAFASIDNGSLDSDGDTITFTQSPAGPYPLGQTTVTLTVTDSQGASSTCMATVTVVDSTPPPLICPPTLVANATSPSGATVDYRKALASDNCGTVQITYSCTTLALGGATATFPIGDTTVKVTATDHAGNNSSNSFKVHVKGSAEQISDLIAKVNALTTIQSAIRNAMLVKLQPALSAAKPAAACDPLTDFISFAKAQKSKKLVPATIADELIADATRIKAVLGCR